MTEPDQRVGMQSVLRSLETLEVIARLQPIRLNELTRAVNLPKTTVVRIVTTLHAAGWISSDTVSGDPRWTLTARALAVGSSVVNRVDLREVARPVITRLGATTDENIHLTAPDRDTLVLIEKVPSGRPVQTVARVGDGGPMHLTASGWAFLSQLPADELDEVLSRDLVATTQSSVVDRAELMGHIKVVREQGYAVNSGMWRADVSSIGAAIVNSAGRPIAAVSISMPSYRFTNDLRRPYGELVRDAAAEISEELRRLS